MSMQVELVGPRKVAWSRVSEEATLMTPAWEAITFSQGAAEGGGGGGVCRCVCKQVCFLPGPHFL